MRDEAMLIWWKRFYADEHVLQMTYEQQGVYWRLLALAWENDGLPNDVGRLAKMVGMPRSRFERRVWPEIAPCWHDDGEGRLRQKRQELERQARQASRSGAAAGGSAPAAGGDRSERMRRLAIDRWVRHRAKAHAKAHANADAAPHADAHANADAATHDAGCDAASPPTPPLVQVQPQAHDAAPHADAHAPHASAVGPASGRKAAAAAERAARGRDKDDGTSPVADLTTALMETRYRGGITNAIARRGTVREEATRLLATGLTVDDVQALAELAGTKSNGDPGALLSHWLDGAWREVLDEQRNKAKEASARRPGQDDQDPILDGIYGAPSEPKAAASVIDTVLQNTRTA